MDNVENIIRIGTAGSYVADLNVFDILFRVVITIFTCAISLLLFKKALNLRNNIKIILIVALNISVLISLYFLPFENLMIDFDTPQSAYSYMNGFNSNVVLEVDGKESVFVVENEEGIYKYSIISKSENGYYRKYYKI